MNKVENKAKRKISIGERIWIVIESLFAVSGIVLLVLGIVSDYLPAKYSENYIAVQERAWMNFSHTSLSFRWLGIIAILIASILAVITLNHYAKKTDADEEREIRRAQRLQVLNGSNDKASTATEVKSEPAVSDKK